MRSPTAAVPDVMRVITALERERPSFHSSGTARWDASGGTLRLLAKHLAPGVRTLEVGVGATTAVFAAAGATHTMISPAGDEVSAVLDWCAAHAIGTDRLTFAVGLSQEVLPRLREPVDLALIDGAHGFPVPVLDFAHVRPLVRVGGVLVLDDVPIPSVALVHSFLVSDPAWQRLAVVDQRAAAFRRLEADPEGDPWGDQAMNAGYPDYSFLPAGERVRVRVRQALATAGPIRRARAAVPVLDRAARAARRRF
jgi:predicted O-methyltransferase YrrM